MAELLAAALTQHREETDAGDQEAYLLTVHGTQMRLVTAYFSDDYLKHVQSDILPATEHLYVRRSRFFELKDPGDKVEALRLVLSVVRYVMSGSATMQQTQAHADQLRQWYG